MAGVPVNEQMATVWTVESARIAEDITESDMVRGCEQAVDRYNLATAQRAIDTVPERIRPSGRGPYLIAWSPPTEMNTSSDKVIILDLSGYTTEQHFLEEFVKWREMIVQNPALFPAREPGFSVEVLRDLFRQFVDANGDSILEFITDDPG